MSKKQNLIFFAVFGFAVLVRTIMYCTHPGGLNQDEASIGYDAWALMNYGIDRNGFSWPVHLMAWGSGQNVLYAYLSMPFIQIFGLNIFSVRIVNLIFSILSIIAMFFMVKRYKNFNVAIVTVIFVAISPWNIMMSRWGLEANLFPSLFIIAIWLLVISFDKKWFIIPAAVLFALSLYSYGSAYLVVTLFLLVMAIYIIRHKLISPRFYIPAGLIFAIIALPIYLFVFINLFNIGNGFTILGISIPMMHGERIASLMGFDYFFKNIRLAIIQYDWIHWNSTIMSSVFYVASLPFAIFGICKAFINKGKLNVVMLSALFCALPLFFIYSPASVNRVNAIYLPLLIFTATGFYEAVKELDLKLITIPSTAFALIFAGFCIEYYSIQHQTKLEFYFNKGFDKALCKAIEIADTSEIIYITNDMNMAHIHVLFYVKVSPHIYIETRQIKEIDTQFQIINSFDRYIFDTTRLDTNQSGIYLISKSEFNSLNIALSGVWDFDNFVVIYLQ